MANKRMSKLDVIAATSRLVHNFYERDPAAMYSKLDDGFVWIGTYDFQWAETKEEFISVTKGEMSESPVVLTDEEYRILTHEQSLWVVYGRYTATAPRKDGAVLQAHVRVSLVWQQSQGALRLLLCHGSNAADFTADIAPSAPSGDFYAYVEQMSVKPPTAGSLTVWDTDSKQHFRIHPSEIVYLRACDQYCRFVTYSGEHKVLGSLSSFEAQFPEMIRIQRGFLANPRAIESIRRYSATLRDGTELPIGQSMYMDVKRRLQQDWNIVPARKRRV